jgi:hypothetical protein
VSRTSDRAGLWVRGGGKLAMPTPEQAKLALAGRLQEAIRWAHASGLAWDAIDAQWAASRDVMRTGGRYDE